MRLQQSGSAAAVGPVGLGELRDRSASRASIDPFTSRSYTSLWAAPVRLGVVGPKESG